MNTTTFNRRDFIKAAGATAAFLPTFSVLSQEYKAETIGPAQDQVNVGVIGYGAEGQILVDAAIKIPGVRIKAVCDIWPYHRQMAGGLGRLGNDVTSKTVYEDYREMLAKEDKNIDAVIIATPDWMHAEHTNYCLKAG